MNQELKDYIKQEKDLGTSDDAIKQKLRDNGWTDDLFKDYFEGSSQAPTVPKNVAMNNQPSQVGHVSPRNKKIAIFWLAGPTLFLVMILIGYAIMRFTLGGAENVAIAGLINIVLGFLGMIATLMIIAGIPIGVIYLNKKEYSNVQYDPRSGKGSMSEIPPEIKGWNWGAAGLTWIWGISNGVWISLLTFIPYFGFIWWIFLGFKGNKWAWQSSPWVSVEDFHRSQDKWKPWGIIFMLLPALIVLLTAIYVMSSITEIPDTTI